MLALSLELEIIELFVADDALYEILDEFSSRNERSFTSCAWPHSGRLARTMFRN